LIVPSVNRVLELEWRHAWPSYVPYNIARARYVYGERALEDLAEDALRAATDLAAVSPAFGVFGCTGGSFFQGSEGDRQLSAALSARMGCPVITASTAATRCLRALGARTVAFLTPYADIDVERGARYLQEQGFDVLVAAGMGIADARYESDVPARAVRDFVMAHKSVAVDVVFLSCTNLESWSVLPELEVGLGRPVVTSNQASMACALRALRVAPLDPARFGSLFASNGLFFAST
jgi:maleate isomerase